MSRVSANMVHEQTTERCCGAACDQPKRDNELKLIGAREYNRLLQKTCMLTDAQIHCLNVVESEYNMLLHPLKG
jgi:hypothetical protein